MQAQTETVEQAKEQVEDQKKVEKSEVYYYFLWGAIKSKNWEEKPERVKAKKVVKTEVRKVKEEHEMKSILGGAIRWSVGRPAEKEEGKE